MSDILEVNVVNGEVVQANVTLNSTVETNVVTDGSSVEANVIPGGVGPEGPAGADGANGVGVPVGGTTGQVLAKHSNTNYDTEWVAQTGGGGGGAVDSVNGQTGTVVLDPDDLDDTSTTHKFVTAAEKTKLSNLSGTNTGDQTTVTGNAGTATALQTSRNIDGQAFNGTADITVIAPGTHAATSKATPVDADEIPLVDSAASNVLKKLTWANLKATIKSYYDAVTSTLTNKDLTSGTNTFPTFNQNTTGSAAKWTTARNLAGNSVDGSANVTFANKVIVQGTTDAGLSAAQFLGALSTGIVKNTTTTGVLSIAVAGDFPTLNQNTTGSAATLTTARNIAGVAFNGSANISLTSGSGIQKGDGSGGFTAAAAGTDYVTAASTNTLTNKTIDGTGTGNSLTNASTIQIKRQNDTTNSSTTGVRIETGWGVFAQGAAANKSETVTFNTAFTTIPIVTISSGGDQTGGTIALGNGGNVEKGPFAIKAYGESTSGFTAHAHTSDGTSWSATANVYYKWVAIGN
jgi:hypothetical protein